METITVGEIVKRVADAKGISIYKLSKDTGRLPSGLYSSLNDSKMRTTMLLELMAQLNEPLYVEVMGKKFKLINK